MCVFRRFQVVHFSVLMFVILPSNFHGLATLVMRRCKYGPLIMAPILTDAVIEGPLSGPSYVPVSSSRVIYRMFEEVTNFVHKQVSCKLHKCGLYAVILCVVTL